MATGNRMGQQGEWNCFSSQPFPLHQEKMSQLVEMGVGVGGAVGGGEKWRGSYCLRKNQVPRLVPSSYPKAAPSSPSPLSPLSPASSPPLQSGGKSGFSWPKFEFTRV